MNKKIKTFFFAIFASLLVGGIFYPLQANAAEMSYTVKAIIPDNQIDTNKTYFDLKMSAGQKQTLEIQLTNYDTKSMTLVVTPEDAATNSNGVIDYTGSGKLLDNAIPFSKLTTEEQTVVLAANETKSVYFEVTMPKDTFNGHVIGAFQVRQVEKETSNSTTESTEGIQLENRFAYVVGVSFKETDTVVKNEFSLEAIQVAAYNSYYSLNVPLALSSTDYLKNYNYTADVYKKNSDTKVFSFDKSGFSMAPTSIYDIYQQVDPDVLTPGTYVLKMKVTGNGETQELEREFTITKADEKKALAKTINQKKASSFSFIWILVIVGLVLLVLFLIFLLLKKKKREK